MRSRLTIGLLLFALGLAAQTISGPAYTLVNARASQNQSQFFVYEDVDSPFNHGFPSGVFGSSATAKAKIQLDPSCVYSISAANGCSSDPTALDRIRGTVFRITFQPLVSGEFAGVNFEEPENWGTAQNGIGYNLTGATQIVFDAVSPTGGIQVQFGFNGETVAYRSIPSQWTTITIPLSSFGAVPLTGVHLLFGIASNDVNVSGGGTVLLDNIHFAPVPTSRTSTLGLPLANQVFGIEHVQNALPGGITVPPDQTNSNLATLYESSLAVIALIKRGQTQDLADAKLIADTFVYALAHDNQGDPLPATPGTAGLHNGMYAGDIALFNSQAPGAGQQGQVRLSGYTAPVLCPQTGFCLVLDGATGGNNAFAILALLAAYQQFRNVAYLNAALNIGGWIYANLLDSSGTGFGGYFAGYPDMGLPKILETGKSTENNADIFAAFTAIANVENAAGNTSTAALWTVRANTAGDFVMQMYDAATEHFFAGTVPPKTTTNLTAGIVASKIAKGNDLINAFDFLDAQTFTTLAMAPAPRYRNQIDWHLPIQWILKQFETSVTAAGISFQGFDLIDGSERPASGGPAGIAWEFTAQTIASMKLVDALYGTSQFVVPTATYLTQIQSAQTSAPFTDGQGLVASTLQAGDIVVAYQQCLITPFQCIAERVGLAATIWVIAAEQNSNPFLSSPLTPSITNGAIVPIYSTVPTITAGEWASIYGTNLASSTASWSGNFPTSLGGTTVTINGKPAYLSYVSPTQINLEVPDGISTGFVPVAVTTAGGTANSSVTVAQFAPSWLLLDSKHVAGIILRSNGSGAYGEGTYDIIGPTGNSLGYSTVAAKTGDTVELFCTGLGPTNPAVPAGQAFSGAAPTTNPVTVLINNINVTTTFAGLSGAGLNQINLTLPVGLGTGDVPLVATVRGSQTEPGVVISLQ